MKRSLAIRMSHSTRVSNVDPSILARAWSDHLISLEESSEIPKHTGQRSELKNQIIKAATNALPLLEDSSSVPFVCRYRGDLISPLTTRQVATLESLRAKHASLESLRTNLIEAITEENKKNNTQVDDDVMDLIRTTTLKADLDELYAPFKPPSKGTILERIKSEHPELVQQIDEIWLNSRKSSEPDGIDITKLKPRDAVVHLLSCRIAAEPIISMQVLEELQKHCRVKTSLLLDDAKYRNYADFRGHLMSLRDHQVLAIRRGVDQGAIKLSYDIDGDKMEGTIQYHLSRIFSPKSGLITNGRNVLREAVHDAWTRTLRRRGTNRLWSTRCKGAQERACQVFEDNLNRALLAPPWTPPSHVLAIDPGFQAGIKCAILDPNGAVVELETIKFLGNLRDNGVRSLADMLSLTLGMEKKTRNDVNTVLVALGNGHGSQEARQLLEEAVEKCAQETSINIQLVNEAGASVWSVTDAARDEFPDHPPAAIASISIGRRLQNPLHELVKVPPKSLGLGMYQHDLSEKELDSKLQLATSLAVATVGVDINNCSMEILQGIPGLNKLATKVIKARPLQHRQDLLKIPGLGTKTFENCAAFCRVIGKEPLDATMVHPESYQLARWLLNELSWDLGDPPSSFPPRDEWNSKWGGTVKEASEAFNVSESRVFAVLDNLVDSMTEMDPRLKGESKVASASTDDSLLGCVPLSPELAKSDELAKAAPVRSIIGTIRNVADFGAFIDFGGHNDGLLHTSKLGPQRLAQLLIGQQLGVDILSVNGNKVSLGLAGLGSQQATVGRSSAGQRRYKTDDVNKKVDEDEIKEEKKYPFIPEPTWSVKELELSPPPGTVPPISDEELKKLCKRALLHFTPEELESSSIRQDLANMMHMINQLEEFQKSNDDSDGDDGEASEMDHVMIYDMVRGVTSAPLRKDAVPVSYNSDSQANNKSTDGIDNDDVKAEEEKDKIQAHQVWKNILQPKTIRRGGGHEYFSIVTQIQRREKGDGDDK